MKESFNVAQILKFHIVCEIFTIYGFICNEYLSALWFYNKFDSTYVGYFLFLSLSMCWKDVLLDHQNSILQLWQIGHPSILDRGWHCLLLAVPNNNSKGQHLREDHKHIHVNILLENLLEYSQYAMKIDWIIKIRFTNKTLSLL